MASFGVKVSLPTYNVLKTTPDKLSFDSSFDMYKIKEERFAQNGETLNIEHRLGYFPFFLGYGYSTDIPSARKIATTIILSSNWSTQSKAYTFVSFNPGVTM